MIEFTDFTGLLVIADQLGYSVYLSYKPGIRAEMELRLCQGENQIVIVDRAPGPLYQARAILNALVVYQDELPEIRGGTNETE